MSKFIGVLILLFLSSMSYAQIDQKIIEKGDESPSSEADFLKQYNKDIKKSKINGKYIPRDLEDAFAELMTLSPKESIDSYKNAPEDLIAKKLHFGLGKWMIANWRFETGSRMSAYLKNLGLTDPNHMAQFLLRTFHRHLNGKELDEKLLVEKYQTEVLEQKEKRDLDRKIIKEEKRVVPK